MIRAAGPADVAALVRLEQLCFGRDAWSQASIQSELTGSTRRMLLAIEGDVVVGYGSIRVVDAVADLQRIAVRPEVRRAGIGRALLDELLSRAAAQGAVRMLLEVARDNEAALGLYARFGFVEISRRARYYAGGTDAIVLAKTLSEPG